jgi:hypothetical protein
MATIAATRADQDPVELLMVHLVCLGVADLVGVWIRRPA